MKNLTRLTLFYSISLIFFSLNKTRANSITSTSPNKILPYNFDLPNNYNSSPSLGFTFTNYINNQHCYMNKNLIFESNNISNPGDYIVSELPGSIPSSRVESVQCEFVEKSIKCPLKMEALFSHSMVMVCATSNSASVAIRTSTILKYATIALLLLMLPHGIPNNNVGGDGDGDGDDDDEDENTDSDDDSELDEMGLEEGDVLVYTYDQVNGNPSRNNQCRLAFITSFYFTTTWEGAADSMHDDFVMIYNLEPNKEIAENPRLCCWGYYARYFEYRDPWSETDDGEPIEEFTPDQDWFSDVQPSLNRINLYRVYYSNGH